LSAEDPPRIGWTDHRALVNLGGDSWRIKDACEGTMIFGGTGSGKTSGSGRALATSFLSAGFGGLVLCAKIRAGDRARVRPRDVRAWGAVGLQLHAP